MNLVSVLIAPAIVRHHRQRREPVLRYGIAGAALVVVIGGIRLQVPRPRSIGGETPEELGKRRRPSPTRARSPTQATSPRVTKRSSELEEEPHLRR